MDVVQLDRPSQRIAVVGKMHSGKTTLATELTTHYGFKRRAFADPVKDAAAEMLRQFVRYIQNRTYYMGYEPIDIDRHKINEMKGDPAIRGLLQLVGTELGRNWYGPDSLWIDIFKNDLKFESDNADVLGLPWNIVCDDCRFPNEAAALNELNFTIIKLVRDEEERLESVRNSLMVETLKRRGLTNASRLTAESEGRLLDEIEATLVKTQNHPSETNVDLIVPDYELYPTSIKDFAEIAHDLARGKYSRVGV